jgi:hypothetical protein
MVGWCHPNWFTRSERIQIGDFITASWLFQAAGAEVVTRRVQWSSAVPATATPHSTQPLREDSSSLPYVIPAVVISVVVAALGIVGLYCAARRCRVVGAQNGSGSSDSIPGIEVDTEQVVPESPEATVVSDSRSDMREIGMTDDD